MFVNFGSFFLCPLVFSFFSLFKLLIVRCHPVQYLLIPPLPFFFFFESMGTPKFSFVITPKLYSFVIYLKTKFLSYFVASCGQQDVGKGDANTFWFMILKGILDRHLALCFLNVID